MKKYSLVRHLLSEVIVYEDQEGHHADPLTLEFTPVDSLSQIYAYDDDNRIRNWSTMNRRYSRYWESFLGDPRYNLYHDIERFFRENPKAVETVRDNLSLTLAKRGKIISSAKPIFYDSAIGGEPWGYMYNGQISPAGRLNSSQLFVAKLQSGGDAENEFAEFLRGKGYIDVKVVGGARNPDVVADGLKFECGTGDKKRLWLGAKFPRQMSPGVASRRKVLDQYLGINNISRGMPLIPKGVYEIWKATGYDFLIKGENGRFVAYALTSTEASVSNQRVSSLTESLCKKSKILQYDGGLGIDYRSIDWSAATPLQ